jgi:hypothetical protein
MTHVVYSKAGAVPEVGQCQQGESADQFCVRNEVQYLSRHETRVDAEKARDNEEDPPGGALGLGERF